jgi:hypothetical protein
MPAVLARDGVALGLVLVVALLAVRGVALGDYSAGGLGDDSPGGLGNLLFGLELLQHLGAALVAGVGHLVDGDDQAQGEGEVSQLAVVVLAEQLVERGGGGARLSLVRTCQHCHTAATC